MQKDLEKREKESGIISSENEAVKTFKKLSNFVKASVLIAKDPWIIYYLLYFIFSVLGLVYPPLFFFCLTYVIVRSSILINVLRAIYEPRKQIVLTLILLIIINYFFTLYEYSRLYGDFDSNLANSCYSVWSCLTITIDQAYKGDGGVGGFMPLPYTSGTSKLDVTWERIFYDYFFNLIIVVLLFEIISGIIIDKFSELREHNENIIEDSQSE